MPLKSLNSSDRGKELVRRVFESVKKLIEPAASFGPCRGEAYDGACELGHEKESKYNSVWVDREPDIDRILASSVVQ